MIGVPNNASQPAQAGGVKNMRTLQPPTSSANNVSQQHKIMNAQSNISKSSKGRLSSKVNQQPPSGSKIGQNRASTSTTLEAQSHYLNGRAGQNLIGQ